MDKWPIIHYERCHACAVHFTDEHTMIRLADGRIIGVPLFWFPPILSATDEQRQNYTSYGTSVYWHDMDDGIDLAAMLTGMYIVPVFQRKSRPKPHVPRSWLDLDGGTLHSSGGMKGVPFVHDSRNIPQAVRFTDSHMMIETADGRILGLPLYFFPWLQNASGSQRQNYQRKDLTLRWEELNENIDLIAMLTGFYVQDRPRPADTIDRTKATTT